MTRSCTSDRHAQVSGSLLVRRASRHQGLPSRQAPRFPALPRSRDDLSGRRHGGWLAAAIELVLAAVAQRRGAEAVAQGAQGHAHRLRARATTTNSCATTTAPISAASRSRRRAIHHGADGRRYLVIHGDHFDMVVQARALARAAGRLCLRHRAHPQPLVQRRPPPARPALLVAVAMAQAQGQERRQLSSANTSARSLRKRSATPSTA